MGRKIVTNASKSYCPYCNKGGTATLVDGVVVCSLCGTQNLFNSISRQAFVPIFDVEKKYRASTYTPLMPDRRERDIAYPKYKDRRRNARRNN